MLDLGMEVLLIRHGQAEKRRDLDGERALVKKGWKQSRAVGEFLSANGLLPDVILTSPLVRARETAEGVSQGCGGPEVIVERWLACGMRPEEAMAELVGFKELERVALVGHEPDLSGLAGALLGASGESVEVKKATVLRFSDVRPPRIGGKLRLLLPAGFLSEKLPGF